MLDYTGCPTTYQTPQFFNNSKTNEDIATRFEQEYVRCVRNEKECVCSKIIKEVPGLVGSGTPYIILNAFPRRQWLRERDTTLLYTHTACLVNIKPGGASGFKELLRPLRNVSFKASIITCSS